LLDLIKAAVERGEEATDRMARWSSRGRWTRKRRMEARAATRYDDMRVGGLDDVNFEVGLSSAEIAFGFNDSIPQYPLLKITIPALGWLSNLAAL
jgi:hypothetical protein